MLRFLTLVLLAALTPSIASADSARTLCTLLADERGAILSETGPACADRVTPASTFKVALAVMGFDSGFLRSPDEPTMPFKKGYPDWGGEAWRRPVGPTAWMHDSVVWYSQLIARDLGAARLSAYGRAFDYGNADFSGDPGKDNGLERSWIGSSLKISPREQALFIARLAAGKLDVAPDAMARTRSILNVHEVGGWTVRGKTGSAFPRRKDGSLDRSKGWGWYVGWAERDGRRIVFVRLRQDTQRDDRPGGLRTRETILQDWPELVQTAG